jgi:phosphoglycerate dehydrogenase-like enzyme
MSESHIVIQTEHLAEEASAWLADRCRLVVCAPGSAEFDSHLATAEALVIRTYTQIDTPLLDRAPQLRVIGRAGVGLDNVDLPACRARNIDVVYTPDANTQAVVEYVLRLVTRALRPITVLDAPVDLDTWNTLRATYVGDRQLNELTIGILGFGRIGARVGRIMKMLGAEVLYHDLREIPAEVRHGCAPVDAATLYRESDVLTVHVDGRPENRHLLNQSCFGTMKPDAIFVNTSRGFVVDNEVLARFLRSHPAAQALLDVHDPEPIPNDAPWFDLPNATVLPHLASRTETAMFNMSLVVHDVWAVLTGNLPRWPA